MALSSKARPHLLVAALVLVVVGVLVARMPGATPQAVPGSQVPATTTPPVVDSVGGDGAGDPYYPQDGNSGYDVRGYDLAVGYDPATQRLDGKALVTATAMDGLSRFNLDLYELAVSEVSVDGKPAEFRQEGEHELVITPAEPLVKDAEFVVAVTYGGVPTLFQDRALGKSGWQVSASGGAFAAGEPHSATTWFPANDTPRDKASFKLAARVPDGWSVVSNGAEGETTRADGWTTYRWDAPQPMATYLTTIAIDKWTIDRTTLADGTPVVNAFAPGATQARAEQGRLPEVLEFLASKFGPYPFESAGGIFLADDIGFSLETQTRPIYAGWADLETVVHENAHQWFGDSVALRSWADICLNECFASYAQWLWSEGKDGVDLDAKYRGEIARTDDSSSYWNRKLYDMGRGNEFRGVYDKGQLAVHALRRQIGDEPFGKVLQTWTAQHRDGNASWPEFEAHVEQVSGQDLDGFFAAWFHGDKIPSDEYLWPGPLRK
ncbi:M1 family metallopeptidase [Actinosynnema sp. NPDC047251]|uniref:Aminopeptidase N n=1 Tax=Saccharothrix espanaensis (strain ATCC 51144 / DSM 44229 / JCM 9112 / NBRC 15066 / NRRL 15764) TaxID=1179773 RepID=K0JR38_SACES|nr:M1 family metallopeptidase [Saccharothrix espanaensis]CCH27707.1 Peptidase M1 membrane alanine aminopeptidase [Saccharothrix espanaensis DSM 44229]